jgi:membrane protease YdiL (CAAX protease family)
MQRSKETRTVWGFVLVCFVFSWTVFFIADAGLVPMFEQQGNAAAARLTGLFGHILGMLGPALAALLLWRFVHREKPAPWKWSRPIHYLWVVLATLAFWAVPGWIGLLLGDSVVDPLPSYFGVWIAAIVAFGWIAGLGEETGWCAYLLERLAPMMGKTRALVVSNVLRGLWHWPVVAAPVIVQVVRGDRTPLELLGASIVIALQLMLSNIFFGSLFGWVWYRTGSLPLVGWMHYWYDMVRDVALMVLVGYGGSLWVTTLSPFVLYPIGFILLSDVLDGEGLDWRRFFRPDDGATPRHPA